MEDSGFGVCRLSVVPVMQSPGWDAPLADELLFGEPYRIIDVNPGGWLRITCADTPLMGSKDGWIPASHHHPIEADYYRQLVGSTFRIVTDTAAMVLYRKLPLTVVRGSILPISGGELFKVEEQLVFNGEAKILSQKRDIEFLIQEALKFQGIPERKGGRTPFGMDPCGWIRMVYRIAGYVIPSDASGLLGVGKPADSLEGEPGDIVLFESGKELRAGLLLTDRRMLFMDGDLRPYALNPDGLRAFRRWTPVAARQVLS